MSSTLPLFLLLLGGAAVGPPLQQEVESEDAFFLTSVVELSERGLGERMAFRFREVTFDPAHSTTDPKQVRDGILRLEYRGEGFVQHEVTLTTLRSDDYMPLFEDRRTFFDLQSGQLVFLGSKSGDPRESAYIDLWSSIPSTFYFALGYLGPRTHESESTLLGVSETEEGRELLYQRGPTKVSVLVEHGNAASVKRMQVRSDGDGAVRGQVDFLGLRDAPGPGPRRPSMVVRSLLDPSGDLRRSLVLAAIEDPWPNEEIGTEAPKGTLVHEFRTDRGDGRSKRTDRSMDLATLMTWHGLAAIEDRPGIDQAPTTDAEEGGAAPSPTAKVASARPTALLLVAGVVTFLGLSLRRRSSR